MPFVRHPPGFRTKHWRALYESYILDVDSLKKAVGEGALFVLIDAEPWGPNGSEPAEIGLSLLPSFNVDGEESTTWTLDDITSQYGIETHWIRVLGRDRREKGRQPNHFGTKYDLEDNEIEDKVSDIIRRFIQRHGSPSKKTPIILGGFSLHFEFCILSRFYPKLLELFTSWVDLQEVVGHVANKADGLITPSLREPMISCGFEEIASQRAKLLHNAATDTVQTAAVLIRVLKLEEGVKLEVKCSALKSHPRLDRKDPLKKRIWKNRPTPIEIFPYAAKVSRSTGFTNFETAEPLLGIFAGHCPVAVGLSGDKKHGWVCLPDLDALQEFVRRVDSSTLDGDLWSAISAHDPTVVAVKDLAELKLAKQAGVHQLAEGKRAQRRCKSADTTISDMVMDHLFGQEWEAVLSSMDVSDTGPAV
ncbi:hypothetical protein B0T11DRAFT_292006 [Plectosphaerella cucumerina]|uniref:Uncharacterized protein n=1 Tax=Plectosphaerella cucumerina TaxID=40658 RepID=A0A8K0WZF3_9PEZI|nr:hypothetical protein B0T11DRAFT_292006 [Plectosphaerella cucumerina]